MEILLELTSNKLMLEHDEFDESDTYLLERFDTSAGNSVKEILLKLNLPDHRSILTDSKEYLKMVMEDLEECMDDGDSKIAKEANLFDALEHKSVVIEVDNQKIAIFTKTPLRAFDEPFMRKMVNDVNMEIHGVKFKDDFIVLDYVNEGEPSIMFGRDFLVTTKSQVDFGLEEIRMNLTKFKEGIEMIDLTEEVGSSSEEVVKMGKANRNKGYNINKLTPPPSLRVEEIPSTSAIPPQPIYHPLTQKQKEKIKESRSYIEAFEMEGEDDWLGSFEVGRNKDGNVKYSPVAPLFIDIEDDIERALAMKAYFNPFENVIVFKKLVDFLGSLPVQLKNLDWSNEGYGTYKKIDGKKKFEVESLKSVRTPIRALGRKSHKDTLPNPLIVEYERRNKRKTITYSLQHVSNANLKWKDFPSVERHAYYEKLSKLQEMSFGVPRVSNWRLFEGYDFEDTLREMMKLEYIYEGDRDVFVDYLWERALLIDNEIYPEWVLEFFSTLYFDKDVDRTNLMKEKCIWFRLCGHEHILTLPEFAVVLVGKPTLTNHKEVLVKEPLMRIMHKVIVGSLVHRVASRERFQKRDLWMMSALEESRGVNLAWIIADHLYKHALGTKENIVIYAGYYVTRIARFLGYCVDEEIKKCSEPIDCEYLTSKMLAEELDEENTCLKKEIRIPTQAAEGSSGPRHEHGGNQSNQGVSYGLGGGDYFTSAMPDFGGSSLGYTVGGSSREDEFNDDNMDEPRDKKLIEGRKTRKSEDRILRRELCRPAESSIVLPPDVILCRPAGPRHEYLQTSERSSRISLDHYCQSVMEIFGPECLRNLTVTDVEKLYRHHEEKHGFPGMLGSFDCIDWEWFGCPYGFKGKYICHAFFGVDGSNNDINILYQSSLFNDLKTGQALEIPFVANGVTYPWGYYLVDGIYPELATLVKMIPDPDDDDHKRILYKLKQESARKDVERVFGVPKKKWAILANPTRALKKERIMNMKYSKIQRSCDISHMVSGGSTSTGRPRTIP
ncbi:retrovirus-related pol polyprotein from transposon TNT 1-94 [Tanacetum coccineum]